MGSRPGHITWVEEYFGTKQLDTYRPDEARAARILRELVKHQRLG